ncbi:MAG: hypothetical protein AB7I18_04950 [Candidatus Berkiella sp.]
MLSMMNIAGAAAQEIAEQGTEAVKEAVTNENAASLLSSVLNAVSHCPSFVTETLDATVGDNPYVRGAATLATLAAVAVPTALLINNCRKKSAKSGVKIDEPTAPPAKLDAADAGTGPGSPEHSGSGSEHDEAGDSHEEGFSAEGQLGEDEGVRRRKPSK